jgi:hypothetical protein
LLATPDATDSKLRGFDGGRDRKVAAVGEFAAFEIGPQTLGRI